MNANRNRSSNLANWSQKLPDLRLGLDLTLDGRVYVLACEPRDPGGAVTTYVGYAQSVYVANRLTAQFKQRRWAAHFCKIHKPLAIIGLWPVSVRAAEAYVYFCVAYSMSQCSIENGMLGGWTQTSTELSGLARLQLERERRMVSGSCLRGFVFGALTGCRRCIQWLLKK